MKAIVDTLNKEAPSYSVKPRECSLRAHVCIVKEVGCDGCKMKPNDTVQGLVSSVLGHRCPATPTLGRHSVTSK